MTAHYVVGGIHSEIWTLKIVILLPYRQLYKLSQHSTSGILYLTITFYIPTSHFKTRVSSMVLKDLKRDANLPMCPPLSLTSPDPKILTQRSSLALFSKNAAFLKKSHYKGV